MQKSSLSEQDLNRLLPEFYPRIYRMVSSMLYGSGMDPEDITQDTFLKVYNKRHLYNGKSSPYTWVYQIARNTVLDVLRRQKIARKIFWWQEPEQDAETWPTTESGDDVLDQRERKELLFKALSALSEKDRLIIVMCDLQGMNYDEISDIEKVPVGTVKSRLFNARQRLKKELIGLGYHSS